MTSLLSSCTSCPRPSISRPNNSWAPTPPQQHGMRAYGAYRRLAIAGYNGNGRCNGLLANDEWRRLGHYAPCGQLSQLLLEAADGQHQPVARLSSARLGAQGLLVAAESKEGSDIRVLERTGSMAAHSIPRELRKRPRGSGDEIFVNAFSEKQCRGALQRALVASAPILLTTYFVCVMTRSSECTNPSISRASSSTISCCGNSGVSRATSRSSLARTASRLDFRTPGGLRAR